MNIHFQQSEKKSQVFFYMLVVAVVLTLSMLILNASRAVDLHLFVLASSSSQAAFGEMSNMPVAVPAPLPPAEQIQASPTLVPSSTPSPLPQAVAVPVPDLP